MEPLVREVGPARFWNAEHPVLTHLFNAINYLDWHCVGFIIDALERVCSTQPDLPEELVAHVRAYTAHLEISRSYNAQHLELLEQLGYSCSIPQAHRFENALPLEELSNRELLALVNAYSWMAFCVNGFLSGQRWFLLEAAAKPAAVFRWRTLIETIHKGALPMLLEWLDVPLSVRKRSWWAVEWRGLRLFILQFYRLLKADGCFRGSQLFTTLPVLYRIFLSPARGYHWEAWRFKRLYIKSAGNSAVIRNAQAVDDFLLNARHYLVQNNPEVDSERFFSGRYFQSL